MRWRRVQAPESSSGTAVPRVNASAWVCDARLSGAMPPTQPRRCVDVRATSTIADLACLGASFLSRVVVDKPSGCWLWIGYRQYKGYGIWTRQEHGRWRQRRAHRLVYEALRGDIPADLQLDHLCRVRHCVNPAHLEAVSRRENILRGESVSAHAARRTYCLRGHELAGANLGRPRGRNGAIERRCLTCARLTNGAYRARRRERVRGGSSGGDGAGSRDGLGLVAYGPSTHAPLTHDTTDRSCGKASISTHVLVRGDAA